MVLRKVVGLAALKAASCLSFGKGKTKWEDPYFCCLLLLCCTTLKKMADSGGQHAARANEKEDYLLGTTR